MSDRGIQPVDDADPPNVVDEPINLNGLKVMPGGGISPQPKSEAVPKNYSLTRYPFAPDLTIDDIVNGTWVGDSRNPVFDYDEFTNQDLADNHLLGAPSPIRMGDKIVVFGENTHSSTSGEFHAWAQTDLTGQEIYGPPVRVPDFADTGQSWSSRGDEANPVPLWIPEKSKGYLLFSSYNTNSWSIGLAETDDFKSFTPITSVNPIYGGRAHGDMVRVGDTIYYFAPETTLSYIKTSVSDFPSGWSAQTQTDFSPSGNLIPGKLLRVKNGWLYFYVDGHWSGGVRVASSTEANFPDSWTDHGEIIATGGAGAWNEGGYRNPAPFYANGTLLLFVPGVPSGGATGDNQVGIWRLNELSFPVHQSIDTPADLQFQSDQTTTSTSYTSLRTTRSGIPPGMTKVWVRVIGTVSNDTSGETTYFRVYDVDSSTTLAEISASGTTASVVDSGWRGPYDLTTTSSPPRQGNRVAAEMKVTAGTGTYHQNYSPGVELRGMAARGF